ncbi:GNAT family N-acetyltransferase [Parazoarcus communis]|uniref:GNAT family N-acetyltransferase n=1 Tax=Parazoarcus communis SWub3 = DSM 12120 TaxID=1121029 RepID=A0A323V794_9RHOO|nr:GNAT family N-acetyltransferase [Parazoarcus communis]NMG70229.1 GNAT family N-acetyltransferase [Parazoarcus communis SWub3 = DSM 12120]PZA16008.1 GNAT family N-acetyltransferase [Azoarcus communis] [Parazoarcus communis SWub3 = DSM 12120]
MITIEIHDWQTAATWAMPLREQVFVVEQGVPAELELDEFDPLSRHALALTEAGEVVGTGRLLPDGHVGRMAVAAEWRGRGVGGQVLQALLAEAANRGMEMTILNAQVDAVGFYQRYGFVAEDEVFMEAGIPHRVMRRQHSGA